ncbi:MAG: Type 1 glutamine amidotransferase-like domain-containing protein [Chloroflexi bacterium]|nr:Type 1 glutamine amidotransferase-like domain-containing protein [Chloroflexota bacterium]
MKFLLTSAGVTNDSIRAALVNLLGKPIDQATAICVPTAIYASAEGTEHGWWTLNQFAGMGWQKFGVLELTALPSILEEHWLPAVAAADIIIVGGGTTGYLSYWFQESGFAAKLPELLKTKVYLGVSAGSMMVTHSLYVNPDVLAERGILYDDEYDEESPPQASSDKTLKLVDFVIRPHLNSEWFPNITLERMEQAAARVDVPLYAIDDQTALKVVDGQVEVVSEGAWQIFNAREQ